MSEPGPNYSKYSYEEWPVRPPEDPRKTPRHVGRTVDGVDFWTTRDVTAKQLAWAERELLQRPYSSEKPERLEQLWRDYYDRLEAEEVSCG